MTTRSERLRPGQVAGRIVTLIFLTLLTGVLVAALALPAVGGIGLTARNMIGNISFSDLPPELQEPPLAQRSVILAADGTELATFYYENRQSVPLSQVAPVMREAIVAIEDSRFYEHHGIDPQGILRALVKDTSVGGAAQGASTITQQYVRQALVEINAQNDNTAAARAATAKTLSRKLTEARYALALEQRLSKDQILEDYLNTVYFGSGAYGIAAAAQHYFSEDPSQLTLPQAALLAGVVNNPSSFDPILNPHDAMSRRNVVLQRMADLHYISQSEADAAKQAPLGLKVSAIPNGCATSRAPFFCQYVVDEILDNPVFGPTRTARTNLLLRGGLTISTTLDMRMQAAAQNAVNSVIPPDPTRNAGLAAAIDMVDPKTGAIKAMAVDRSFGAGFGQTEVNLAADLAHGGSSGRHAGSTFKIFVLASALQQGIPTGLTLVSPNRITIKKGAMTDCNGAPTSEWKVANAGDSEAGTFNMVQATALSVNTYFAQLETLTGLCKPIQVAEAMGVRQATGAPLDQVPSFVLGAEDVDPLTMAAAFATLANQGMYCKPFAITAVTRKIGETTSIIKVPQAECHQALDPSIANGVTALLRNVLAPGGTGAGLGIGRPAAGKTGTDDEYRNAWFSGYTPNLAASVWVGNPDSTTPMRAITVNGHYYREVFGATLPGPIWQKAMTEAVKGLPVQDFPPPPDSVMRGEPVTVPDVTGKDLQTAINTLQSLGLVVTVDPTQVNSTEPAGTVASTDPPAGSTLYVGNTIVIHVSNGISPSPTPSESPSASSSSSPPQTESPSPSPSPSPSSEPPIKIKPPKPPHG
ncbi:MAG: penicillin-binding protein [Acidothermus sp.]|nr:penicillin-binding protein [Acidothermus sp.]